MNDGNGVEAGAGGKYIRVTGRDYLVILILAAALGYIVWNISKQHERIIAVIEHRCGPSTLQPF